MSELARPELARSELARSELARPELARPELARPEVLIGVAHGSKDPRAAATIESLLGRVRRRLPGVDVRAAYLGHAAPSLPSVLGAVPAGAAVTVLPLLLTDAYHSKVDLPRLLPATVACGSPLGPHPLLVRALERRLAEAGVTPDPGTAVVLAAAGSSDPAANAAVARMAAAWQRMGRWRAVVPAFASAAAPAPAEAVAALSQNGGNGRNGDVVVASYLLAPGFFADRIREQAIQAGATAVSAVLGAAPEVAALIADRYAQAALLPARRAAA
jgi:sirohydrochlorin ferrochelatase